jgi:hypothetical protein
MEDSLSSTSDLALQAIDRTSWFLCLLMVMVMVPWIGAYIEGFFGGDDDEPDGFT